MVRQRAGEYIYPGDREWRHPDGDRPRPRGFYVNIWAAATHGSDPHNGCTFEYAGLGTVRK